MKSSKKFLQFVVLFVFSVSMVTYSIAQTGKTLDNPKTLPSTKQLPTQTKTTIPSKYPENTSQKQKTLDKETKTTNDKRIIIDNDDNHNGKKWKINRGKKYGHYSKEEKERMKAEDKAAREQAKAERKRKSYGKYQNNSNPKTLDKRIGR